MDRNLFPYRQASPHSAEVCFIFNTNNTSNPLTTSFDGAKSFVATVVRSGVGVIVVTLTEKASKVLFSAAELDDTANDGAYATVGSITNEGSSSALSLTIRTRAAAGTLTDFAARRVMLKMTLRNTSAG